MKGLYLLFFTICLYVNLFAVEGMWMPMYLEQNNIEEMQKLGLKLSSEDIYSNDNISLKDAVVIFGRGCTGAVISDKGLVITNHHCGFGQIQKHASLENDILKNGFWAKSLEEELTNPGLTVRFLVYQKDVTDFILKDVSKDISEKERKDIITDRSKILTDSVTKENHYSAEVKSFFQGNKYYLIVNEVYKDVRLVGAPPSAIGKFGGDTDNWMWPRHTGDFALFRVYTDSLGMPAEFSPNNIPLKPKKHFEISIDGVKKDDFTFVFGYPGTTQQYLPSIAVKHIKNSFYPARINVRTKKLDIIKTAMDSDPLIRIKYAAKAASISNAWKKWKGEIRGLNKLNAIQKKKIYEKEFQKWLDSNPDINQKYGEILAKYKDIYKESKKHYMNFYYYYEAGIGTEAISFALKLKDLNNLKNKEDETLISLKAKAKEEASNHFKDYDKETDKKMLAEMLKIYTNNVSKKYYPEYLENIKDMDSENAFEDFAEDCFNKSVFTSEEEFSDFIDNLNFRSLRKLKNDPIFILANEFHQINKKKISPKIRSFRPAIDSLNRLYMQAQIDFQPDKLFYPDANFTMRITYGKVDTYYPADGVKYNYYTTLDGIMEKNNPEIYDYDVPEKLRELYINRDYGKYAYENNEMRVCFIASNHTTGGNSGSPVLNAEGKLIGLNFDRNWEGTMSDIMYDPDRCRNITVDIKYALFIIDKFAEANNLIDELDINLQTNNY